MWAHIDRYTHVLPHNFCPILAIRARAAVGPQAVILLSLHLDELTASAHPAVDARSQGREICCSILRLQHCKMVESIHSLMYAYMHTYIPKKIGFMIN